MQAPHVAVDARDAQQPAAPIDQGFEPVGIEVVNAHQVDKHPGIEVAGARAHDHPAGGREAHAGVDGHAVLDRADAGAMAEVGDHQPRGRASGAELLHDRLERQPVETVALQALLAQLARQRQNARHQRHAGMKRGVETRDLRQPGEVLAGEPNERQCGRHVQRRKRRGAIEQVQHRGVDSAMTAQQRPAVHDAVADGVGSRQPALRKNLGDTRHRLPRIGRRDAVGKQRFRAGRVDPVQAELERRRAAVQREDVHRVDRLKFRELATAGSAVLTLSL